MKRNFTLAFVIVIAITIIAACSKKEAPKPNPPVDPTPTLAITDFNPKTAKVGDNVMIKGTAFGSDASVVHVKFGTSADVTPSKLSATEITATVPADAKTGKIQVTVNGSTVTSADDFMLTTIPTPVVTITEFSPQTAKAGETVTITGTAFGTDTNFVSVKFGSSAAVKPKSASQTSMTVVVPKDAQTGKIQVTVNGGTPVNSATDFTFVLTLAITDFSPKAFTEKDTVAITGTNFGTSVDNVKVYIESNFAIKPIQVTPRKIIFIVPYDTNISRPFTGKLTVTLNSGDLVKSSQSFNYLPIVGSDNISPMTVRPGNLVSLHFTVNHLDWGLAVGDLNATTVAFNGTTAQNPISATRGYVKLRVPDNAKTGKIQVGYTGYATGTSTYTLTVLPKLPAPQSGKWIQRPDIPGTDGRSEAVAFVIGSKAYVATGNTHTPFGGITKEMYEYDPQYDSWTPVADFMGGNRQLAVAFAIGSKGYVGLGVDDYGNKNDFWEYDPTSNTWTQKADFKGSARQGAVAFALGSKGYVGSGKDGTWLSDFYSYDPAGNTWRQIASMPDSHAFGFAFVANNNAYVGGGVLVGSTTHTSMYMYNPSTDSWTAKAAFSERYSGLNAASFSISGKGYVGLGEDPALSQQVGYGSNHVFEYNPSSDSWKAITNFSGTARMSAIGFAINDVGYFGLGNSGGYTPTAVKDFWSFKN